MPQAKPEAADFARVYGSLKPFVDVVSDEPVMPPQPPAAGVLRVAVVGSSEIMNMSTMGPGLSIDLERALSSQQERSVQVIDSTWAALSLELKRDAVALAVDLEADLVIVTLPMRQVMRPNLFEPGDEDHAARIRDDEGPTGKNPFDRPLKYILIDISQSPLIGARYSFSRVIPHFQRRYIRMFHGAAADDSDGQQFLPEDGVRHVGGEPQAPVNISEERLLELLDDPIVATAETLEKAFVEMAKPATTKGIPVVIYVTPLKRSVLNSSRTETADECARLVDESVSGVNASGAIIINGLWSDEVTEEDFRADVFHFRDFENLSQVVVDSILEHDLLNHAPGEDSEK